MIRTTKAERDEVTQYIESQVAGETVVHSDRLLVERVGSIRYEVWDVHTSAGGRWWVITNPTNFYTQDDLKSANVALSFHIGIMARVMSRHTIPIAPKPAQLLPGSWRRWEDAVECLSSAGEAADFQAVGMQLRECLVEFASEVASDELMQAGVDRPQAANVVEWAELLAGYVAAGPSLAKLRSYLKAVSKETWAYVNWLTHARNAIAMDAEIAVAAVSNMLSMFTATRLRWETAGRTGRCAQCDSYDLRADTCSKCGWVDEQYEASAVLVQRSEKGRAESPRQVRRLGFYSYYATSSADT